MSSTQRIGKTNSCFCTFLGGGSQGKWEQGKGTHGERGGSRAGDTLAVNDIHGLDL